MDDSRFDLLARSIAEPRSRRAALRAIAGLVLGGSALVAHAEGSEAATKRAFGVICRKSAECQSGVCGPKDRKGRRRCTCSAGTVECGGACQQCCQAGDCGTSSECSSFTCDNGLCAPLTVDNGTECFQAGPGGPCSAGSCCPVECVDGGCCGGGCFADPTFSSPEPATCCDNPGEELCGDVCCYGNQECVNGSCCTNGTFGSVVCGNGCCAVDQCCNGSCCGAGQVCRDGACETPPSCTDDASCGVTGETCVDGVCCDPLRQCEDFETGDPYCCAIGTFCERGPSDNNCTSVGNTFFTTRNNRYRF
jgi:hypothetical protein